MTSQLVATLVVPGSPRSKQRPRSRPGGGRSYTPRETVEAEKRIRQFWYTESESGDYPKDGRFRIDLGFYLATAHWVDLDNLTKLVTDALNDVAYLDDKYIEEMRLRREFRSPEPRTEIKLYLLED